jgi:hypothetical protein
MCLSNKYGLNILINPQESFNPKADHGIKKAADL